MSVAQFVPVRDPDLSIPRQEQGFNGHSVPPVLRSDLDIHSVDPDPDGSAAWVIHDQATNRYYRIGQEALDMLGYVDGRAAEKVCRAVDRRFRRKVSLEDVEELFTFLRINFLVVNDSVQERMAVQQRQARPDLISKLLKGYISFRIPLVRPDRFLEKTLWIAKLLSHPLSPSLCILMGAMGLYLVSRQLDVFLATLVGFVSFEGLFAYVSVLLLVKVLHELGHAYAAKLQGLRVPTIGVAFIVFWPVAYTDTTDAWKLSRRSNRLKIGVAGVATEAAIACIALFLWNLTADGPVRSVLFLLATTTWVTSLLINLNPLMRFDGYYLFSDIVKVPNLEQRANTMGKWKLRSSLLGNKSSCPEPERLWLSWFAFAVWTYRFFLFLGIALAVYLLFPKAVGIVLAAIEVLYFIGLPIYREVSSWFKLPIKLKGNASLFKSTGLFAVLTAVIVLPIRTEVLAPGVLKTSYHTFYAPEGGQIVELSVGNNSKVQAGQRILLLQSDGLDHELGQALKRQGLLQNETRSVGVDAIRREQATILRADLLAQARTVAALQDRQDRMTILAPMSGVVSNLQDHLRTGTWVSEGEILAQIIGGNDQAFLDAYVSEQDIGRIKPGTSAVFYPVGGLLAPIDARVNAVDSVMTDVLLEPMLTSSYEGDILVRRNETGQSIPLNTIYKVRLRIADRHLDSLPSSSVRGKVALKAEPESILDGLWSRLKTLLVRETVF